MEISLANRSLKGALILLEVAAFLILFGKISTLTVADQLAAKRSIHDFELAIKLDPGNSEYRLQLGRLYRFDMENVNPDKALEHLKRAVELDPASPQTWIDLGAALEFQGKIEEADACLRRADSLAPHLSNFQWIIGNFFLLHGNADEAFRAYKIVLAGTSEYDRPLFDTAWKATGDGRKILDELIPDRISSLFSYLNYLILSQHYPETQDVWKRIASNSETFSPLLAAPFIDKLIEIHQAEAAYQVWKDLGTKGLIRPAYEENGQNLIINGDFEEDILNMGFDWRINPTEGAYVGIDRTEFHSPSQALTIQFMRKQNVDFRGVFQYVKVEPDRAYQFRGFIKTEAITTNSGPRFEIRDAYDGALLGASENFTGATGGWTPVDINLESSPRTHLVIIELARPPSEKLDNLIAGKVWIDDISLTPQLQGAARRGK
jgi:hypothetical protein